MANSTSTLRQSLLLVASLIVQAILFSAVIFAQDSAHLEAIPSRRLVTRGEMLHPLSEIYLDLEASAGKPDDMVAMRICSREPLPVAIFLAVMNPLAIGAGFVRGENGRLFFSPNRVIILRSPDCPVTHPPYTPLEFWGVPQGAAPPSSAESVKLCQVEHERVGSGERIRNPRAYRAALRVLIAKLRSNPEAISVIKGEYNNRPGAALRRNIREAERMLRESKLSPDRFYVRTLPSALYDADYPQAEPHYPDMFIVRVRQSCGSNSSSEGRANKGMNRTRIQRDSPPRS